MRNLACAIAFIGVLHIDPELINAPTQDGFLVFFVLVVLLGGVILRENTTVKR